MKKKKPVEKHEEPEEEEKGKPVEEEYKLDDFSGIEDEEEDVSDDKQKMEAIDEADLD